MVCGGRHIYMSIPHVHKITECRNHHCQLRHAHRQPGKKEIQTRILLFDHRQYMKLYTYSPPLFIQPNHQNALTIFSTDLFGRPV